jgi:hypothetical protein
MANNIILETKFFSKKECERIVNTLIKRENEWESRSPFGNFFMSYGALTYLDTENYNKKVKRFNNILLKDFDWIYTKIKLYYENKFDKPIKYQKALPGFHIFQNSDKINTYKDFANIHSDLTHLKHNWKKPILSVFSFTIALELPNCGAGLNFWPDFPKHIKNTFFPGMNKEDQKLLKETAVYFPYKLGYIYEHTGLIKHQITVQDGVEKGEKRITMQGHLVETTDEVIIYV